MQVTLSRCECLYECSTSCRCECLYASDSVFVFDDLPRVLVCKRLRLDASVCDYVFVFYDLPRVLV